MLFFDKQIMRPNYINKGTQAGSLVVAPSRFIFGCEMENAPGVLSLPPPAESPDALAPAEETSEQENSVDVESLGGIGRMFGAMISRFGHIPIPTQAFKNKLRAAS